jgi:hypothetical protein
MDRNPTNEPRGRGTQAEKAERMPSHHMLRQAIANLEAVAAEMRLAGATSPAIQCWADKVLTAVSDLKEPEAAPVSPEQP